MRVFIAETSYDKEKNGGVSIWDKFRFQRIKFTDTYKIYLFQQVIMIWEFN